MFPTQLSMKDTHAMDWIGLDFSFLFQKYFLKAQKKQGFE